MKIKQKTFIFSAYDCGAWNKETDRVDWSAVKVNKEIDDFIIDKDIVSIKTSMLCRGNNPCNYAIVYVVLYK